MRRFRFDWFDRHDGMEEWFDVAVEDGCDPVDAFRSAWATHIDTLKGYQQNKDKTFETADEMLASGYTIRELGDPALMFGPRPGCCEQINKPLRLDSYGWPTVSLQSHTYDPDNDVDVEDPHWIIRGSGADRIHFCPFCGKKLPPVERMGTPPHPLHSSSDGNYCDTCGERNMACGCNPPWAAYEIKAAS